MHKSQYSGIFFRLSDIYSTVNAKSFSYTYCIAADKAPLGDVGFNVLGCRDDILGKNEAPSEKPGMACFSIISEKTFHNGVSFCM